MDNSLKIVFMGTPEFAVASLDALVHSRHKVVGVITVPDKPASRGLKLQESAVKKYSIEHNLKLLQPEKLKNETFLEELKALNADLFVVVAFRMLPEAVWKMPRLGTINLHGSLLPQYRGAAPINWAIINGEQKTGVTTFFINQEIDQGDIIDWEVEMINENDDAGELHDRLMKKGATMLVKDLDYMVEGTLRKRVPQDVFPFAHLKLAPKIFRESCKIDWNRSAEEIFNFIRGLSPHPGAWTELIDAKGQKSVLKIFKTKKEDNIKAGIAKMISSGNTQLFVGCRNSTLEILELQPEGRKRMTAADFLRGIQSETKSWDLAF